ncbi:kinase-like protein, partial [Fragilariopsis cylindrus CCMP1102]
WDVSEGMKYLHKNQILFRDLKTENVGSTSASIEQYQRMQIFDFGLAREYDDTISSFYDTYRMTGLTGTLRIMAPEVIQCSPYGLSADVYSFGICMWEVFQGTKCDFLSAAEICNRKNKNKNNKKYIGIGMPKKLQNLMQQCWNDNSNERPTFNEISSQLS